jgi:hypothetical protein
MDVPAPLFDFIAAGAFILAVGFVVLVLAVWASRVGTDLLGRFL